MVSPADLCLPILSQNCPFIEERKGIFSLRTLTKIEPFVLQIILHKKTGTKNKISLVRKLSRLTIRASVDNLKI